MVFALNETSMRILPGSKARPKITAYQIKQVIELALKVSKKIHTEIFSRTKSKTGLSCFSVSERDFSITVWHFFQQFLKDLCKAVAFPSARTGEIFTQISLFHL